MAKFNAENERVKRQYFVWEKEANGKSVKTVDHMRNDIFMFEEFTGFKSFKRFNQEDIIAFKKHVAKKKNQRTNEPVSKTYLLHVSMNLISFFKWLCRQNGYKRSVCLNDINYFNLSDKDMQIARSSMPKRIPTLSQLKLVVEKMPFETDIQKRNRAIVAFLILTACRGKVLTTLKIKHVCLETERVDQIPQEVETKFSKKIITYFFPVDEIFKNIVIDWVNYLINIKQFDYDAPLFPNTKLTLDENDQFSREMLDFAPWKSTTPIRNIIKQAFKDADLPYYNPHAFRNTIVLLSYKYCKTPEDLKAWSQNIGHNSIMTTLNSYGQIDEYNQGKIIKRLGQLEEQHALTPQEISDLKKILAQKNS